LLICCVRRQVDAAWLASEHSDATMRDQNTGRRVIRKIDFGNWLSGEKRDK
jgi:hypothetical protein